MIRGLGLILALCAPAATLADPLRGQEVYETHCIDCHLADGSGGIGADIRHISRPRVERAIKGFDEMPPIPLTVDQLDALMVYLALLGA